MVAPRLGVAVPGALLGLQLGLMVWLAPRGLDLTDESYALLSLIHWRELPATPTLFAWFIGPVFAALDHNVAGIRVAAALALVGSAGWATWALLRLDSRWAGLPSQGSIGFVLAGMAAGLLHYSFSATLRVPAYNALVLVTMLVSLALFCEVLDPAARLRRRLAAGLGFGAAVAVAGLAKPTSGVALVLVLGLLAPALWPGLRARPAIAVVGTMACGGALVLGAVQLYSPAWWRVMLDGAELARMTDGRSLQTVLAGLQLDAGRALARLGAGGLVLTLALVVAVQQLAAKHRATIGPIVVGLVLLSVIGSLWRGYGKLWWALHALALLLAAVILWRCHPPSRTGDSLRSALALGTGLMALPVAFSIGTNGSLPAHTQMASTFAALALLLALWRLRAAGLAGARSTLACLGLIAGAGLLVQGPALRGAESTYRLGAGLLEQTEPLAVGPGGSTLLVEAAMWREARQLREAAAAAGLMPGDTLIDLTGDSPGWVLLLDARPAGVAWVIGGYPGSERAALAMLRRLPSNHLRQSWLLTSDNGARQVAASPAWMHQLDPRLRYREVAMIQTQRRYSPGGAPDPSPITLRLWQPAGVSAP